MPCAAKHSLLWILLFYSSIFLFGGSLLLFSRNTAFVSSNLNTFEHNDSPAKATFTSPPCKFLPGVLFNSSDRCDMLAFPPVYARGTWIRNCNPGDAGFDAPPMEYAGILSHMLPRTEMQGNNFFHMNFSCSEHHSPEKQRSILHYYWQPAACTLREMHRQRLTAILKRHRFLFVGDSIMWQTVASIAYLTGVTMPYQRSFILVNHKTLRPMTTAEIAECELHSSQSDSSENCPNSGPYHRALASLNWTSRLSDTDVLVFSIGHHWWKEDRDFTKYHMMANNVTDFLAQHFRGRAAVFVSAVAGHPRCLPYEVPLVELPLVNDTDDVFKWGRTTRVQEHFRQAMADTTRRPGAPQMVYLYTNHTALRPEAHYKPGYDCLHYCQPGVVDTWVHLLYNLFEDLAL